MTQDRLLTEIERQKKYLAKLPPDFTFPLFNSKQALESQRRNGYRNTASAAREIIDNSLEAGAKMIRVAFERPASLKAHQRQDSVSAVAFIDDGSGMLPEMARFALSWGGGTHFEDHDFIGRFGFGLPNASINQTRRVEIYTRIRGAKTITKAWLDVTHVQEHGLQTIAEPTQERELPAFVQRYLKDNKLSFEHGTVVVWLHPDRLTYRTGASLRDHLIDDFGVVYRYLLDGIELFVENTKVEPVDPLFLDPHARYHLPEQEGGAILQFDRSIPVKYFKDPETGALHLSKVEESGELNTTDPNLLATGSIHLRIARFPPGLAVHSKHRKTETDAHRRFEVRKSRRGISFVRAGREVETLDAFPRSLRDVSSGLGKWPLLQGYAYHWGVEVKFSPSLDEVFGITHDKQTVRPIEDFWRLMAREEIDRLLHLENKWQAETRMKERPSAEPSTTPSPAERAVATVSSISGHRPQVPDHDKAKVREQLQQQAQQSVGVTAKSMEEALAALASEAKRRPFLIDYIDEPNGPFYKPDWKLGSQIVAYVNRRHPFYTTLYGELLQLQGGRLAKEAVDVLLLALSKAELTIDDETAKLWYQQQREKEWSSTLATALKVLLQAIHPTDEEEGDTEQQAELDSSEGTV